MTTLLQNKIFENKLLKGPVKFKCNVTGAECGDEAVPRGDQQLGHGGRGAQQGRHRGHQAGEVRHKTIIGKPQFKFQDQTLVPHSQIQNLEV